MLNPFPPKQSICFILVRELEHQLELRKSNYMDIRNHEIKNKGLHLVKTDINNFWPLLDLRVTKEQEEFVASNGISLAQAYDKHAEGKFAQPFGIYDGDTPVGFAMLGHNSFDYEGMLEVDKHSYCLWRFMIDHRYQKSGYGRDALKLLWDYIQTFPDGKEDVWSTSYVEGNDIAAKLYHEIGFVENGEKDDDELVAVMQL